LVAGAFSELAWRTGLFSGPFTQALRKARHLPRAQWGMALAHGGLGIVVAGVVGMTAWRHELVTALKEGESAHLGAYTLTLEKVGMRQGPNYEALVGVVHVMKDGRDMGFMMPEKRRFPVERQEKTEAAIRTNGLSDLYVVIGDDNGQGGWTIRAYENNFAPWIWAGAIIMAAGGLVSLTDRRYRVGAPSRARTRGLPQPAE
jgi:cytochrome c-type biogenesis protein CcmF